MRECLFHGSCGSVLTQGSTAGVATCMAGAGINRGTHNEGFWNEFKFVFQVAFTGSHTKKKVSQLLGARQAGAGPCAHGRAWDSHLKWFIAMQASIYWSTGEEGWLRECSVSTQTAQNQPLSPCKTACYLAHLPLVSMRRRGPLWAGPNRSGRTAGRRRPWTQQGGCSGVPRVFGGPWGLGVSGTAPRQRQGAADASLARVVNGSGLPTDTLLCSRPLVGNGPNKLFYRHCSTTWRVLAELRCCL